MKQAIRALDEIEDRGLDAARMIAVFFNCDVESVHWSICGDRLAVWADGRQLRGDEIERFAAWVTDAS